MSEAVPAESPPIRLIGVDDGAAVPITHGIRGMIRICREKLGFDLTRLEEIVVADDYPAALAAVDRGFQAAAPATRTETEHATGVAMALPVRRDDGVASVLLMDAKVASGLLSDDDDTFDMIAGMIAHELAHVHDQKVKVDAMPDVFLAYRPDAVDSVLNAMAEKAWSEYYACRATASLNPAQIGWHVDTLHNALRSSTETIVRETLESRLHADIGRLWPLAFRHADHIMQMAAYVLGTMDALGLDDGALPEPLRDLMEETGFRHTWEEMRAALRGMHATHPDWREARFEVYRPLMDAADMHLSRLGFDISLENGNLYIDIPLRPETTPFLPGWRF